jgi:hypothetical protein
MVEGVEQFPAKLNISGLTKLANREVLEDADVEVHRAWTFQNVASSIPELVERGSHKGALIKPIIDRSLIGREISIPDPAGTWITRVCRTEPKLRRKRQAGPYGADSVYLPITPDGIQYGIANVEPAAVSERQIV